MKKIIHGAPIKNQCCKDFFYGKSGKEEEALGFAEGSFASMLREIINTERINPKIGFDLCNLILIQMLRTEKMVNKFNHQIDSFSKIRLNHLFKKEELSSVKISVENAAQVLIGKAIESAPLIFDLKKILLINRSSIPFVIGDDPVAQTNLFNSLRLRRRHKPVGLASAGLQLLMPISPRHCLLFHDANVYSSQEEAGRIVLNKEADVSLINQIQYYNCNNNVYFPNWSNGDPVPAFQQLEHSVAMPKLNRWDYSKERRRYHISQRDEFSLPPASVDRELIEFQHQRLPIDLRIRGIGFRDKPRFYDTGTMAGAVRDKVWIDIVDEYGDAVAAGNITPDGFFRFAFGHPLAKYLGLWVSREIRGVHS